MVQWEVKDGVHAGVDTVPASATALEEAQVGGVDDPRLADGPDGGMGRLETSAPFPPEGAVDHRVSIEPYPIGFEQRGPPERLLNRIARDAWVAHVEVGQDAGEPAVGQPPALGLTGVGVRERLEAEVAQGRAVERAVEPVIRRRAGEPAVLRAGVAQDVVLDHLQAEPMGFVHEPAKFEQRAEARVRVEEVDRAVAVEVGYPPRRAADVGLEPRRRRVGRPVSARSP